MDQATEDKLKLLPPGAVIHVWGESLFGKLIRWYEQWKLGQKNLPNHTAVYFGAGKHSIIEANASVQIQSLERYMDKRHTVYATWFKPMSVNQLSIVKAYCYGSVGKPYDIPGILAFIFKQVHDNPAANFCTEMVVEAYQSANILMDIRERVEKQTRDLVEKVTDPSCLTPGELFIYLMKQKEWQSMEILRGDDWK